VPCERKLARLEHVLRHESFHDTRARFLQKSLLTVTFERKLPSVLRDRGSTASETVGGRSARMLHDI